MQVYLNIANSISGQPQNTESPTVSTTPFSQILADKVNNTSNEEAIQRAKGKRAAEWLAQRFGLPLGFFMVLLDKLGITTEQLGNPETQGIALNTLANYFDLSDEEREDLFNDFRGLMETLDRKIK